MDVLSEKYLVFVNSGYEIKDASGIIYTINDDLPEVTSFQGITYVSIEHALNTLDVSGNYEYMYKDKAYDIYTNTWNVSLVTDMNTMFAGATNFNQPLNNWDVSNVTNMRWMFQVATNFNQPLNNWDVSNVTDMNTMFAGATNFNQPLNNWDVSNVTNMRWMFQEATNFNQPLNNWDVSNVTDMREMLVTAVLSINLSIIGMCSTM